MFQILGRVVEIEVGSKYVITTVCIKRESLYAQREFHVHLSPTDVINIVILYAERTAEGSFKHLYKNGSAHGADAWALGEPKSANRKKMRNGNCIMEILGRILLTGIGSQPPSTNQRSR